MNRPAIKQQERRRSADLKVPPYATQIAADVKTVWISAGPDAWDRARRWKWEGSPGLVLPPGEDPGTYFWPVRGFNVALIATDMAPDDAASLVGELINAGAVVIAVLYGDAANSRMELVANGRNV